MGLTFNIKALCTLSGILKVIQIALAFICIALLRHYNLHFGGEGGWGSSQSLLDRRLVGIIAIGSSILISLPLLFAYIFFAHSSNLLEVLYCFTACIMNVTGGSMAIDHYNGQGDTETVKAGMAMGCMMIINALVYLIDAGTGTIANRK
ncbi:hypothetical protein Pmani_004699 [Petrolisthes manimaculis]|uniref:MARVEL domain-containing protein n=2 Tax=Petrolisthes TaxID=84661 RepID=A0AAE1Q6R4_9EUCA|nr:hypothetical protein Pcinc_018120 [Petrolisthes cinctipes]KAK4321285.1 hypothetical protein Pmani_007922 [Petrolisthes manimaculis]KAK4324700.1 hypothetical protein Pmani_004699 [Petrolisthes manimaculis]